MQLKYRRETSIGSFLFRLLIKIVLILIVLIVGIFVIEKIDFPSPKNKFKIDITNEIKKLK